MKIKLLFVLLLLFNGISKAQDKSREPIFGLNFGFASIILNSASFDNELKPGYFVGGSLHLNIIHKISVRPKILYANYSDVAFFHVPVLAGYNLTIKLTLQIGPQVTVILDDPFNASKDFGLDLGFGVEYDISKKVFLQGRYSLGLTNRFNEEDISGLDGSYTFDGFMFGLGYQF